MSHVVRKASPAAKGVWWSMTLMTFGVWALRWDGFAEAVTCPAPV